MALQELLERAAPLLRLPGAKDPGNLAPEVIDGGLHCPSTGRVFTVRDGVLDLLDPRFSATASQRALDFRATAWLYDWMRPRLAPLFRMPSFSAEVTNAVERLGLARGDTVLNVACGQGNFNLAFARHVGPEGLVFGIDIAQAMLARAVRHMRTSGVQNVLLIRGDALALPFAAGAFPHVACSGGLHQIPDLPRAFREFRRVAANGGRLTASGFATAPGAVTPTRRFLRRGADLHAVDLGWLEGEMAAAGYEDVAFEISGGAVGYIWGRAV
jgi:ubiquinone/menaquinone biosynthesis C-methylase UbiE